MEKFLTYAFVALFAILVILGFGALMALPVYLLWNYVAPVFHLPALTFLQSWAVMILFNMLVRGVVTINKTEK